MAQETYQKIDLLGETALDWPSSFSGRPIVLDINDINATTDGPLLLPDATLVQVGQSFVFNNIGTHAFQVKNFADQDVLILEVGDVIKFYLRDNTIPGGQWGIFSSLVDQNSLTNLTVKSTNSSILVNGIYTPTVIVPPNGTIDLALPPSIENLNTLVNANFLVINKVDSGNSNTLSFVTRSLVAGDNITITPDGTGVTQDPVIGMVDSPTFTTGSIGGLNISDGTITPIDPNGNVTITTKSPGIIDLNGVTIDADGNISGGANGLATISAYVNFTDSITGSINTISIQEEVNVSSVVLPDDGNGAVTRGTYKLTFDSPMPDQTYGVIITTGTTMDTDNLPVITHGYYLVRNEVYVIIAVADASGELVLQSPNGVTVMIISK